jgi:hypothetical protein
MVNAVYKRIKGACISGFIPTTYTAIFYVCIFPCKHRITNRSQMYKNNIHKPFLRFKLIFFLIFFLKWLFEKIFYLYLV